jgi:hypothetical protein
MATGDMESPGESGMITTIRHSEIGAASFAGSSLIQVAPFKQPRTKPWGCFISPTSRSTSVVQLRALVLLSPPLRGVCNGEPLRRSKTRHFTRRPVWNVTGMNEEAFKGQVKGSLGLTVDDVRRVRPMTGQSTEATPTTDFQIPAVEFFGRGPKLE